MRAFPYSPYNRQAHIAGLNFIGTDVALSHQAAERFSFHMKHGSSTVNALRMLSVEGFTFEGIDSITYTRS